METTDRDKAALLIMNNYKLKLHLRYSGEALFEYGQACNYLAEIHHNALMHLLPQMGSEDLDEGNLQCGDLTVHKDASQIQLHLETNIYLQHTSKTVVDK